ncbi:MAG TPA: O-antigen ligase family protein [Ideonella sp.]|uniref:O-antigen ligase family protein n=1 Tax=Ideonella sp. TaxID=1929293 RepID=UPI002C7C5A22|nr:O-antigen ligase family protein [Ideonella sp.]HSI50563.1 O-antigen ligase family protein [Ideonella sp.]
MSKHFTADAAAPSLAAQGALPSAARSDVLLVIMAAAVVPLYLSMFRFGGGGVLVRLADLLALALIVGTFWTQPAIGRAFQRPHCLMLMALVLGVLIQGMLMNRLKVSVKEAVQLAFVVVVVTTVGWHAERDPTRFLKWFIGVGVVAMLHTVAIHIAGGNYVRYKLAGDARYIFGVVSAVLLLAWRQAGWRGACGWLFLMSLPPLVASMERKGLLGVILIALGLALAGLLRSVRVSAWIALLLAVLLGLAMFSLEHDALIDALALAEKNNYFVDQSEALWDSNTHRTALLLNGVDIVQKQPWFGSGADSLREQMGVYFSDSRLSNSTHNFFLDNLIKYGLLGGGLFFAAIFTGLRRAMRLSDSPLEAGLFSVYMLFAVFFISDGQAVTVMALLPTFIGLAFNRRPTADAQASCRASATFSSPVSLSPSGALQ